MDRPVSQIMTQSVWTALESDPVDKVEEFMARHRVSSIPVVDGKGAIFGIISNSDLLRAREAKRNLKASRAWELCTYRPVEATPTTPVVEVARLMVKHKVHHVVITERTRVVGFVSALDLVEQFLLSGTTR